MGAQAPMQTQGQPMQRATSAGGGQQINPFAFTAMGGTSGGTPTPASAGPGMGAMLAFQRGNTTPGASGAPSVRPGGGIPSFGDGPGRRIPGNTLPPSGALQALGGGGAPGFTLGGGQSGGNEPYVPGRNPRIPWLQDPAVQAAKAANSPSPEEWAAQGPGVFYNRGGGQSGDFMDRSRMDPTRAGGTSRTGPDFTPPMTAAPPGGDPFSRPTSAMDVYRSSVPVMQDALKTNVGNAMADAGFSGNRFGSYAMDRAAQEGSRAGLQQNQLLTGLLHDQTNRDLDRSLQASGLGLQHGTAANQMQLDRMRFLADQGRYEQDRADRYGMLPYQDFEQNKLGFLPMLMQMAQSSGAATAPTWGTQQTGGSPGFFDYAKLAAQLYGAYRGGG